MASGHSQCCSRWNAVGSTLLMLIQRMQWTSGCIYLVGSKWCLFNAVRIQSELVTLNPAAWEGEYMTIKECSGCSGRLLMYFAGCLSSRQCCGYTCTAPCHFNHWW